MSSMSASSPDICGVNVQALYLNDPGNKQEPVGYVLCSEMGNTCMKNGCSCRSAANAEVNGTTKYFGVCVVLQKGKDCATSGDDYLTCAVSAESSGTTESQNESAIARSSTTTQATTESNATPSASVNASASASGADNAAKVSSTAASSHSMSSTVMVVIIVVAVVFVALVSWVVRSYCTRRSAAENKLASRRNRSNRSNNNFDATSPTNVTGRSSATPSFPAFDRRTRAMQSPTAGGRGGGRSGRNTPRGREPNSGRGREPNSGRGRRNQDIDALFAPGGPRDVTREPPSGRERRNQSSDAPFPPLGGPRREATSGRGRNPPDTDAPFPPLGGPRREPTSGRGRRTPDTDAQFVPSGPRGLREPGPQREPTSGHGRRDNGYQAEAAMRTPPRDQRVKQHASPKQPTKNGPEPSGGTVYTGRNTYDRVAAFAQLAAFEAPPPPPPRPQRPIKPVPVADPVPKNARAPPPARPKRPGFHIPDASLPTDYDILSPKTARSLAPSVASSATTVVAPGRNRPTPLQQHRRPQYSNAPPSYYQSGFSRDNNKFAESEGLDDSRFDESKYDESNYGDSRYDESGYEGKFKPPNKFDDSFVSEVSSMAWSGASGLSDESYYHAAGSNTARIPVIEAPRDDDDDHSEDGYSDWGHSTQHSADAFRSTAASDASFFSVNSDFADTKGTFKEREF
ncbi:hypothetical protein PHYPSEUDO_002318 [Phytophthora pseudosyringae]|uniref:Uncharacterized protein n=1 Tax=Phytophthora pseudosyringae TaxID=221518 RepID=A0A8T1WIB6_9STRA|nr:hypothetical protein PHYPSEUDO_002318 [Phytophthora pseudosyringae]